jgi:hypothetical protein
MTEVETAASETIAEWCAIEKMSKATFYSLRSNNPELAPRIIKIPKTRIVRVIESHESWRARVAEAMQTKTARLANARRRELTSIAGKIAAQSPKHVSRRDTRSTSTPRGRRGDECLSKSAAGRDL